MVQTQQIYHIAQDYFLIFITCQHVTQCFKHIGVCLCFYILLLKNM